MRRLALPLNTLRKLDLDGIFQSYDHSSYPAVCGIEHKANQK